MSQVHVWRSPAGADTDVLVIADVDVYSAIDAHSQRALPNETGGFLLGSVGWDTAAGTWIVRIDEAFAAEPLTQTPVHFTFSWRDVDRVRNHREGAGKALVGWYHTHPQMGIFMSQTDVEKTHRVLFSELFQVALVYDPVGGQAGYFFWEGPQLLDPDAAAWREFQIAVHDDAPEGPEGGAPVEIVLSDGAADSGTASAAVATGSSSPESRLAEHFRSAAVEATAAVPRPTPGPVSEAESAPVAVPPAQEETARDRTG